MQTSSTPNVTTEPKSVRRTYAVIRFKRRIALPRFTVEDGERWSFLVWGKQQTRLEQIRRGERFEFGGAQVLAQDVEIIYEGRGGLEYNIASGAISDPQIIEALRKKSAEQLSPLEVDINSES